MPKLSVVLPVHNGERFLAASIQSVLDQTYTDFELLVINDHSTDRSGAIVASFADHRVTHHQQRDRGLVAALNTGISIAKGEIVVRMDADDLCFPNRFEKQLRLLQAKRADVVYADAVAFTRFPWDKHARRVAGPDPRSLRQVLSCRVPGPPIIHPTVMIRRQLLETCGGYRSYPCAEDRDLWLRMIDTASFEHLAEPVLYYRLNPDGVSRANRLQQAISSILAIASYEMRIDKGVDMYADCPAALKDLQPALSKLLRQDIAQLQSLDSIKTLLRHGDLKQISPALNLALPSRWWTLSQKLRTRRERQLVKFSLELLQAMHTMENALRGAPLPAQISQLLVDSGKW